MRKKRNYWNRELAFEKALLFNNKRDFKLNYGGVYEFLRKNDWLDDACAHMIPLVNPQWTYERCREVAQECITLKEFRIKYSNAYKHSRENGWFNKISNHFIKYNPKIYWKKEKCQNEANKYNYRTAFSVGSPKAYAASSRNGWLDEICNHMEKSHQKNFKWTKDECGEIALKYNFRKEFQIGNKKAYSAARHNGWLDDICQHMKFKKLPNRYWHDFNNCENEALKYKTKTDFIRNSQHVYNIALKKDWIDKICQHMIPRGDKYHRCIYVYEFPDNYAYVGLTYDLDNRKRNRKRDVNDAVTIHIKETNSIPIIKKVTDYIPVEKAIIMEKYYYNKYVNEGWKILNRTKTGGLGGSNFK